MKAAIVVVFMAWGFTLVAQPKEVSETVVISGQGTLDLSFDFADKITFKTWDKNEVHVAVLVNINDGEHNDIFSLQSSTSASTIYITMDKDMWKKVEKNKWNDCNYSARMDYSVFLPKGLTVRANTISGDYALAYFDSKLQLETISGVIDVTVPDKVGLDFKAKTVSGEVYSDLEIEYPYGKEGLRQLVGQDIHGRISSGGPLSKFKTISGNIYLRSE